MVAAIKAEEFVEAAEILRRLPPDQDLTRAQAAVVRSVTTRARALVELANRGGNVDPWLSLLACEYVLRLSGALEWPAPPEPALLTMKARLH